MLSISVALTINKLLGRSGVFVQTQTSQPPSSVLLNSYVSHPDLDEQVALNSGPYDGFLFYVII